MSDDGASSAPANLTSDPARGSQPSALAMPLSPTKAPVGWSLSLSLRRAQRGQSRQSEQSQPLAQNAAPAVAPQGGQGVRPDMDVVTVRPSVPGPSSSADTSELRLKIAALEIQITALRKANATLTQQVADAVKAESVAEKQKNAQNAYVRELQQQILDLQAEIVAARSQQSGAVREVLEFMVCGRAVLEKAADSEARLLAAQGEREAAEKGQAALLKANASLEKEVATLRERVQNQAQNLTNLNLCLVKAKQGGSSGAVPSKEKQRVQAPHSSDCRRCSDKIRDLETELAKAKTRMNNQTVQLAQLNVALVKARSGKGVHLKASSTSQSLVEGKRKRSPDRGQRRRSPNRDQRRRSPEGGLRRRSPEGGPRRRSPERGLGRDSPEGGLRGRGSERSAVSSLKSELTPWISPPDAKAQLQQQVVDFSQLSEDGAFAFEKKIFEMLSKSFPLAQSILRTFEEASQSMPTLRPAFQAVLAAMPPATRQLCRADILAALPQPDALLATGPAVRSCLYDVKLLGNDAARMAVFWGHLVGRQLAPTPGPLCREPTGQASKRILDQLGGAQLLPPIGEPGLPAASRSRASARASGAVLPASDPAPPPRGGASVTTSGETAAQALPAANGAPGLPAASRSSRVSARASGAQLPASGSAPRPRGGGSASTSGEAAAARSVMAAATAAASSATGQRRVRVVAATDPALAPAAGMAPTAATVHAALHSSASTAAATRTAPAPPTAAVAAAAPFEAPPDAVLPSLARAVTSTASQALPAAVHGSGWSTEATAGSAGAWKPIPPAVPAVSAYPGTSSEASVGVVGLWKPIAPAVPAAPLSAALQTTAVTASSAAATLTMAAASCDAQSTAYSTPWVAASHAIPRAFAPPGASTPDSHARSESSEVAACAPPADGRGDPVDMDISDDVDEELLLLSDDSRGGMGSGSSHWSMSPHMFRSASSSPLDDVSARHPHLDKQSAGVTPDQEGKSAIGDVQRRAAPLLSYPLHLYRDQSSKHQNNPVEMTDAGNLTDPTPPDEVISQDPPPPADLYDSLPAPDGSSALRGSSPGDGVAVGQPSAEQPMQPPDCGRKRSASPSSETPVRKRSDRMPVHAEALEKNIHEHMLPGSKN